jgi:methyltransferase (TIGR00027 family)
MQVGESFAGVVTAATRVVEMYQPEAQRLFDDPLAYRLLPFGWRLFLRLAYLPGLRQLFLAVRERRMPGSLGSILCRTRYLDDVLKKSLAQGLDQIVILGAGFDTRAYRIDGMNNVGVFEVDLPGWRQAKETRLEKVLGAVPANVSLVGIDFDRQDLGGALSAAGFGAGERTLFIWEGVTQYLTADAVTNTLAFVSGISGAGSSIVFTYVRRGIVDGTDRPEWMGALLSFASKVGSPMTFGLDQAELAGYLADRGLMLVEDVGAADYQERYLEPVGRKLDVFDGERAALAVVAA